jgi:hypothetical protein
MVNRHRFSPLTVPNFVVRGSSQPCDRRSAPVCTTKRGSPMPPQTNVAGRRGAPSWSAVDEPQPAPCLVLNQSVYGGLDPHVAFGIAEHDLLQPFEEQRAPVDARLEVDVIGDAERLPVEGEPFLFRPPLLAVGVVAPLIGNVLRLLKRT